jgi:hypothetical protein
MVGLVLCRVMCDSSSSLDLRHRALNLDPWMGSVAVIDDGVEM